MLLRDGGSLQKLAEDRPGFFSAVDRLVRMPMIPGPGSMPITRDGLTIGAVGVSGARPEQDLECCQAGLRSIKLQGA
jgi:glc operon protein GlcG